MTIYYSVEMLLTHVIPFVVHAILFGPVLMSTFTLTLAFTIAMALALLRRIVRLSMMCMKLVRSSDK